MAKAKKTIAETLKVKKTSKKAASKTAGPVEVVRVAAEEMLSGLGIEASVAVTENEGTYLVNVETAESGLLIGYHGETLSSFQLLLGLVVFKKLGEWVRVVVEVGDYRAKREQQLIEMAESYANQVVATGQAMTLPYLPPIERRVIHLALQDRSDVETVSEGEGDQRRIVVKPKTS